MASPNKTGLNTFLAFTGVILSFVSLIASVNGGVADPYLLAGLMVIAVIGAFMAGVNLRAAADQLGAWVDRKFEEAARKAVDAKMPALAEMVGDRMADVAESAADTRLEDIESLIDERIDACFKVDGTSLYIETPKYRREREAREEMG